MALEAMSYGLPIVMTPCEGSEELIDGNGFVTEIEEFQDKLVLLCNDGALRKRMGQRSRELAEERFQWSRIAEEYIQIFYRIKE